MQLFNTWQILPAVQLTSSTKSKYVTTMHMLLCE
jgi:hypothetical protein